ncbi:MAG: hypothetical protein ACRELS_05625 [Candidatus Rokuibacteriota bacterium]
MDPFEYPAPSSIDDAPAALAAHGAGAKVLVGGQSLRPLADARPESNGTTK